MPDSPRECLTTEQKKNNESELARKFRQANLAFKEARKNDSQRFSSSRETLAALTEKRRRLPAHEARPDDEPPIPQYDPADEAGYDAGTTDVFANEENDAGKPDMSLAEALKRVPATIQTLVGERFRAEFTHLRRPRNVFSYRGNNDENAADEDSAEDESDDA